MYTSLEICAGAGGQALGLERAGFNHTLLVEYEPSYCACLKANRPGWDVRCMDVHNLSGIPYYNRIDLLSGGVPCPPFSHAGKQLGADDERDLFPEMIRLAAEINPKVVMIENVRGFLDQKFSEYRERIINEIETLGYNTHIQLLNASDYGVPQLRPRVVIIGVRNDLTDTFSFPPRQRQPAPTVGEALFDLMSANEWQGAAEWRNNASTIAPTLVGGSKKHGGPDLGPTRARKAWAAIGIEGKSIANDAPQKDFTGMPRLTPRMMARIQGFPDSWSFGERKTTACRMIGNAFPPPMAEAVGKQIFKLLYHNECIDYSCKEKIS